MLRFLHERQLGDAMVGIVRADDDHASVCFSRTINDDVVDYNTASVGGRDKYRPPVRRVRVF